MADSVVVIAAGVNTVEIVSASGGLISSLDNPISIIEFVAQWPVASGYVPGLDFSNYQNTQYIPALFAGI